ncbi:MAG: hypothetical protein AAGH46_07025 [Bacteroidota bacterium]
MKFRELIQHREPTLLVKYSKYDPDKEALEISLKNNFKIRDDINELPDWISATKSISELHEFYNYMDGLELFVPQKPKGCIQVPLITFLKMSNIIPKTREYQDGGKWAWTIDLNKTKKIYRSNDKWVVFAIIGRGPACLTIFTTGENKGSIFYLTPQPPFRPCLDQLGANLAKMILINMS